MNLENIVKFKYNKKSGKGVVHLKLTVFERKEDANFVIVCPAINIAIQGDTIEEAHIMFEEVTTGFLRNLVEKKQLFEYLKEVGWYEINNAFRKYEEPLIANEVQLKNYEYAVA
jgi:predicted RNase H-like HicB family nuclease